MDDKSDWTNDERESAERELRRGNFKAALDTYERLCKENPADESLARRLADLRELLQPMELTHPKTATGSTAGSSAVHEAEAAANRGDIHAAIAGYEELLGSTPDNVLFQERLEELRALASDEVMAGAMPRSRPSRPRVMPLHTPSADPAVPTLARLGHGEPPSEKSATSGLPVEPEALLEELLSRIRRNRRPLDS